MNTTSYLSLGQAAKETGKSKGTISKYLKSGKLSYLSKEGNQYQIDPAELFRVFPQEKQETAQNERMETLKNTNGNSALEKEIELLHERLKEKDEIIADIREDRDQWRQQATALLTDQRSKQPQKSLETPLTIWQWLGLQKR